MRAAALHQVVVLTALAALAALAGACSPTGDLEPAGPSDGEDTGAFADTGVTGDDTSTGGDAGDTSPGGDAGDTSASLETGGDTTPDPTLTPSERTLIDLPADSWLKVPGGYGAKCDDKYELEWHAVTGCSALIGSWNSAVWDPVRRQMLLFGGGHDDYAGNEIYAYSTKTLTWTRLTEPSPKPYNKDPLDDGKPVSRHTYDGLTWIDHEAKMLAWGGARSNDGNGTNITWLFNPATKKWTAPPAASEVPPSSYSHSIVYDPVTKQTFVKTVQDFQKLDPSTNGWTRLHDLGYPPYWPRYTYGHPRGTLDTKRRNVWYVGGELYMIYAIDAAKVTTDDWVTTGGGDFDNNAKVTGYPEQRILTGGGDVIKKESPGFDYDSRADQMVAWVGGGPYVLNLTTRGWSRKSGTGAPLTPIGTGTFGRWRYLREYNVFILVTSMDEVYFYKNTAGP